MKVRLLYFASLREQLGRGSEDIELPAGISSVAALRSHLTQRGGAWQDALSGRRVLLVAVNQDMAGAEAQLQAGDEVAFFPPVTGG